MLVKLLKYDLKWIYKALVIFYILATFFAVLGRGLSEISNSVIFDIAGKISMGISISMIISIIINNLMRSWARFVRNLFKDESYLTHTLPVNKNTIYLSKILSSIITMFTSGVVISVLLFIMYYSKENIEIIKKSLETFANIYETNIPLFLISVLGVFFIEIFFALISGYLGIILGHKSNNLKLVKSLIYGFGAYMVSSVITLLIVFIIGLFNSDVMNLFNTVNNIDIKTIKFILVLGTFLYITYVIIYYLIGEKILNNGIDIE